MKIQGVTIIFSLIIIPVILVMSFYIQMQVDTIALQTSYDTKLLDATHDAMAAFEINTANESLSSVADSLRSIITASNNIFINTLATNLGMSNASQSMIQPYIPAVLYTLYDGYYIYSPTRTPIVLTNYKGNAVTVGDVGVSVNAVAPEGHTIYNYTEPTRDEYGTPIDGAGNEIVSTLTLTDNQEDYGQILYEIDNGNSNVKTYTTVVEEGITKYKLDYVLKSFMPYSAKYTGTYQTTDDAGATKDITADVVINYTLDNYVIINGTINSVYYSKSGYMIKSDLIATDGVLINNDATAGAQLLTRNEEEIDELIDGYINAGNSITVILNTIHGKTATTVPIKCSSINDTQNLNAVKYYIKAKIFSDWVYENLSGLKESHVSSSAVEIQNELFKNQKQESENIIFRNFGESLIFDPTLDPESDDSIFANHKTAIIRNSIQFNLNVAMSAYNQMSVQNFSFNMPVVADSEWKKITSNVTIVSFMQGFKCGLKTYNNYAIVPSTNNELTVIPEEIYYVMNDDTNANTFNDEHTMYHRIDCPMFTYPDADLTDPNSISDRGFTAFRSKEVKYDKIYNKTSGIYEYDHKNSACYRCIVNPNYKKAYYDEVNDIIVQPTGDTGAYSNEILINTLSLQKQRLYYTAVGAEREKIYKSNAIEDSQGLEVIVTDSDSNDDSSIIVDLNSGTLADGNTVGSRKFNEIKEIRIVVSHTRSDNPLTQISKFDIFANSTLIQADKTINVHQENPQTITINIDSADEDVVSTISLTKKEPAAERITYQIDAVEFIYK